MFRARINKLVVSWKQFQVLNSEQQFLSESVKSSFLKERILNCAIISNNTVLSVMDGLAFD